MKIYESPQKDVNAYLQNPLNIELYNCLTDGPKFKNLFEPLYYFNLLYKEIGYFLDNAGSYVNIKPHFNELELDGEQRYFFLYPFKEIVQRHFENLEKTVVIASSIDYIQKMYHQADKEIFPFRELLSPIKYRNKSKFPYGNYQGGIEELESYKEINQSLVPYTDIPEYLNNKFTWKDVMLKLEKIPDDTDKIKYLIEISSEYKHLGIAGADIDEAFIASCEVEIDKLKTISNLGPSIHTKSALKLSEKKGTRIDIIRIINALHPLNYFVDENGVF